MLRARTLPPPPPPALARVTFAVKQQDPAWQQGVAPVPDRRQRHLPAVWLWRPRGCRRTCASPSPAPL